MNGKARDNSINVDQLFRPRAPEMDLNQPVEATSEPADFAAIRSTVDPFQINFATVDVADKLHNSRTPPGLKILALVLFGVPAVLGGLLVIVMAWSDPGTGTLSRLFQTCIGLAVAGFWPYVIFVKSRGKASNS